MDENRKLIADTLRDIISKTPNTQELHPLLCALAEVANQLHPLEKGGDFYEIEQQGESA